MLAQANERVNHADLCLRAVRWLRGTRRCNPVYSLNASCSEVPDAIGWSSAHSWYGSTVIECKTSVSDFYADKKKWFAWKRPGSKWTMPGSRFSMKEGKEAGYEMVPVLSMGDFRFYFCELGVLALELIEKHAPDHGLIWRDGRVMRIIRTAPRREMVDKDAEIRYLRFAIINRKWTQDVSSASTATTTNTAMTPCVP